MFSLYRVEHSGAPSPIIEDMTLANVKDYWFLEKGDPSYKKYWDLLMESRAIEKFSTFGMAFVARSSHEDGWAEIINQARLQMYKFLFIMSGRELLHGCNGNAPSFFDLAIKKMESHTEAEAEEFVVQVLNSYR